MKRKRTDGTPYQPSRGHAMQAAIADRLRGSDTPETPKGFTFLTTDEGTVIRYRWFRGKYLMLTLWVAAFTYAASQIKNPQPFEMVASALMILPLGYYTLTGLVNRTQIVVNPEGVVITHGPLPLTRGRRLVAGSIQSLSSNMPPDRPWAEHSITVTDLKLYAHLVTGKRRTLLSGLAKASHVVFVAGIITIYNLAPGGYRPAS